MKRAIAILALLCSAIAASAQSTVKWTTSVKQVKDNIYEIQFTAAIADGLHIYDLDDYSERGGPNETVFTFNSTGSYDVEGRPYCITKPTVKYYEEFKMDVGSFAKRAVFVQKVRLLAEQATVMGSIEWQACRETTCLMPEEWAFEISVSCQQSVVSGDLATVSPNENNTQENAISDTQDNVIAGSDQPDVIVGSDPQSNNDLWSMILQAIGWGLLAILTPCVFPMLPMTVSFFMKNGGRRRAIWYGVFIVALYVLPIAVIILTTRIAGGATVTVDIFNWLATHWLPNVIFFIVFMVFAASFFGAFEIALPSKLANKTDAKADKGGLLGVLFMAMTLVLVSFSCTGPLVGSVLILSTAGEFWTPIVTIAVFATVFALPFVFFAFFPSLMQKLPKSGGWFNTVKVILGFVELALGLKFLSVADQTYNWGLLDREIYLALWIVIFSLLGFYLLGKLHFKHDSEVKHIGIGRLVGAIAVFTFVVYLLPGMWGAPLKGISGYLPPLASQDFVLGNGGSTAVAATSEKPRKYSDFLHAPFPSLDVFFDYNEALEYSKKVNKPLLLDFTGKGCVSCREMESRVWSDPEVLAILSNEYVLVEIFLDDRKTLPESEWVKLPDGTTLKTLGKVNSHWAIENYKIVSQPTYVIVNSEGSQLLPARGYNLDVAAYVEFLRKGIAEYN